MGRPPNQFPRVTPKEGDLEPGALFQFLKVLYRIPLLTTYRIKNSRYVVECVAPKPDGTICGVRKQVARSQLVSGDTGSCGCMKGKLTAMGVANWRNVIVPEEIRLHDSNQSARCPSCRKCRCLRRATIMSDGEIIPHGRWCFNCQRITVGPKPGERLRLRL